MQQPSNAIDPPQTVLPAGAAPILQRADAASDAAEPPVPGRLPRRQRLLTPAVERVLDWHQRRVGSRSASSR